MKLDGLVRDTSSWIFKELRHDCTDTDSIHAQGSRREVKLSWSSNFWPFTEYSRIQARAILDTKGSFEVVCVSPRGG